MRRVDATAGSLFQKSMEQYTSGFGLLYDSFWLGLKYIHRIANAYPTTMRIEMVESNYEMTYVQYENLTISENFSMKVENDKASCCKYVIRLKYNINVQEMQEAKVATEARYILYR